MSRYKWTHSVNKHVVLVSCKEMAHGGHGRGGIMLSHPPAHQNTLFYDIVHQNGARPGSFRRNESNLPISFADGVLKGCWNNYRRFETVDAFDLVTLPGECRFPLNG